MTPPTPDRRIRKEAADWFARLNARTVSVGDLEAFRAWRAAPDHRAAYDAVEAAWRRSGTLIGAPDIEAALAEAVVRPHRRPRVMGGALLAAGVAILAVVAAGLWHQSRSTRFITETGERRIVRLSDGSELHLDTASLVTARLGTDRRDLTLVRGQAFFVVAPDRERPFTVTAGATRVVALGTRFDVRRDGSDVRVTLVEGAVSVRSTEGQRSWRLAPGEQIVTRASAPETARPVRVDAAQVTAWTEGRLAFDALPLGRALAEVNRYETRPLTLAAGVDPTLPISGVFDAGHGPAFAEAAARLHGLTVQTEADQIRLQPGPD